MRAVGEDFMKQQRQSMVGVSADAGRSEPLRGRRRIGLGLTAVMAMGIVGLAPAAPAGATGPSDGEKHTKVVFTYNSAAIWIMDGDGNDLTQLTTGINDIDLDPALSPDGKWIAFCRMKAAAPTIFNIWIMDTHGRFARPLTKNTFSGANNCHPTFSPDDKSDDISDGSRGSRWIAFHSNAADPLATPGTSSTNGNYEIFKIRTNGTGTATNLTNSPNMDDTDPSWSPNQDKRGAQKDDGSQIAWVRSPLDENQNRLLPPPSDIWTMHDDGSDQKNLTMDNSSVTNDNPAFSWNGEWIAWDRTISPDTRARIYKMGEDGEHQTRLTNNSTTDDRHPTWAPGDKKIGFARTGSDNISRIWEMESKDGDGKERLSDFPHSSEPCWGHDDEKR
jgi:Tol biopolymer transport system component